MGLPEGPVYENPSADKFVPPPPPPASDSRADDKHRRRLTRFALVLAMYVAADWLRIASRNRAWWTVFSFVLLLALSAFEYVMQRHGDADDEKAPYSPPTHLTR